MIAIPTAYTTGFNNRYNVLYIIRMNLDIGNLLYVSNQPNLLSTVTLKYNGVPVTAGNYNTSYLAAGILSDTGTEEEAAGIGEVDYELPIQDGGGLAAINEANILFLNQGRFDDFISEYDIENREIEIWEGFVPPSGLLEMTTDMILRFRGIMQNIGRYDYQRYYIPCVDRRRLDGRLIPLKKISKESYPRAPKSSVGKPLQILVGDFTTENLASYGTMTSYEMGLVNAAPVEMVDENNQYLFISEDLTGLPGNDIDFLYYLDKNIPYIAILNNTKWQFLTVSGQVVIQILSNAFGGVWLRPNIAGGQNAVTDFSAVTDSDATNYLHLAGLKLSLGFDDFQEPGVLISGNDNNGFGASIDFQLYVRCQNVIGNVTVGRRNKATGSFVAMGSLINGTNQISSGTYCDLDPDNWASLKYQEFEINAAGGTSLDVYNIWVVARSYLNLNRTEQIVSRRATSDILGRYYVPEVRGEKLVIVNNETNIFVSTTATVNYGAWIAGRGTSATQPGKPIYNPAYFIEYLLRDKLNIPSSRIDAASFDSVFTARTTWYIDSAIQDQQQAFDDIIRRICFEFSLMLVQDASAIYKLIALDNGASVYTIQDSDLIYENGKIQIELDKTPIERIKNDIFLKYRMNYANKEPERSVYVSDTDGNGSDETNLTSDTGALRNTTYMNWMNESITQYQAVYRMEETLEYIRDDATANAALKKICDWLAFKRVICRMKVKKSLNTLALVLGDIIKINNTLLGIHQNLTTFLVTRVNYPPVGKTAEAFLTIEAEEIPNILTGIKVVRKLSDSHLALMTGTLVYEILTTIDAHTAISPSGSITVLSGANQTFVITKDIGYLLLDLFIDEIAVTRPAPYSYTFTNVLANHTIRTLSAVSTFTITASAGSGGTISPSGGVSVGNGDNKTFIITPTYPNVIASLIVDGGSVPVVTAYMFINVMAAHTISATFGVP